MDSRPSMGDPDNKRPRSLDDTATELDSEVFNKAKQGRYHSPVTSDALSATLDQMTDQIVASIKDLAVEVHTNTQAVSDLLTRNSNLEGELANLRSENFALAQTVATLEARQLKTDEALKKLQATVIDNQVRQMNHNILLYGVPESASENTLGIVHSFLTKKMKIPANRIKVFRHGS